MVSGFWYFEFTKIKRFDLDVFTQFWDSIFFARKIFTLMTGQIDV